MKSLKLKSLSALIAASLMMGAGAASAAVVGGGATLPQNLYNDIFTQPIPGFDAYTGVGSGNGKKAFFENNSDYFVVGGVKVYNPKVTVDYAGSDSLVSATELTNYNASVDKGAASYGKLIQIPAVLTSVTVPYNVTGVTDLNLTSEQLAQIFSGAVTNWSQVGGPSLPITVVYRSDSSGTTEIFARHLNNRAPLNFPAVSNNFATAIGKTTLPTNFVGVSGSGAVPTTVTATVGAIGYVSPDFVDETNNAVVARINSKLPTEVNVQAAIAATPVPTAVADRQNPLAWGISNANPADGYPIVASTNLILSQCYQDSFDRDDIRNTLELLYNSTLNAWDADISAHGFIPLPKVWKDAVHTTFYNQTDALALAVGHPAECTTGRGRPN